MAGPLLVTDAPHLLYRAFYALPDSITGPDGQPTNALLGSVNVTLQAIEDHAPRAVVMCFGAEAAEYRTEAFPAYHAHRPPMPEGLAVQWAQAPACSPTWRSCRGCFSLRRAARASRRRRPASRCPRARS